MDETGKKLDDLPAMPRRHRKEGFPGQHHVVLPPSVTSAASRHPLLASLFVTDAGKYPTASGHRVSRPKGASGAIFIICTAGRGWVQSRNLKHSVAAGDVVLISPNQPHSYGAHEDDPWTIEWSHFSGSETLAWCGSVVGQGILLSLHRSIAPVLGLARLHEILEEGYDTPQLLQAATALRHTLTELIRLRHLPNHAPTAIEAVEATAHWMRDHTGKPTTLAALAKMAGMSPSRYSEIFRQRFGFPPMDWFMRQRIRRACHLLDVTQEKIEVVGLEMGFKDPYYFSRCFRKVMGTSPRNYRAITKG